MVYVVFAEFNRVADPTSTLYGKIPDPECYYMGTEKSAALTAFQSQTDISFSTACPHTGGSMHFTVFDNDTPFLAQFTNYTNITVTDIQTIKNNLKSASCDNVLTYVRPKTKTLTSKCAYCGITKKSLHKTAYDQWICGACWDDSWLRSVTGQIEYVLGLADGRYSIKLFSQYDQEKMLEAWNTFVSRAGKTETELAAIKTRAEAAGLVFNS